MFGCSSAHEADIIRRLRNASTDATHPLLIPGIIAELERKRHGTAVDRTVDALEMKILEVNTLSLAETDGNSVAEKQNEEKRTAWLDTTYLRNQLVTWKIQLEKMEKHAEELSLTLFRSGPPVKPWNRLGDHKKASLPPDTSEAEEHRIYGMRISSEDINPKWKKTPIFAGQNKDLESEQDEFDVVSSIASSPKIEKPFKEYPADLTHADFEWQEMSPFEGTVTLLIESDEIKEEMRRIGYKIHGRIRDIMDEYEDRIRDCTMRVDGMAMATQWVGALDKTPPSSTWTDSNDSTRRMEKRI